MEGEPEEAALIVVRIQRNETARSIEEGRGQDLSVFQNQDPAGLVDNGHPSRSIIRGHEIDRGDEAACDSLQFNADRA